MHIRTANLPRSSSSPANAVRSCFVAIRFSSSYLPPLDSVPPTESPSFTEANSYSLPHNNTKMKISIALITFTVCATVDALVVRVPAAKVASDSLDISGPAGLAKRDPVPHPAAVSTPTPVPTLTDADGDDDLLVDDNEEVALATPEEEEFLASLANLPEGEDDYDDIDDDNADDETDSALSRRDDGLEKRGGNVVSKILKILLKKISKTALGKKVWNKLGAGLRKTITKYLKSRAKIRAKVTAALKAWLKAKIKPTVKAVLISIIGKVGAKLVLESVLPWIVDFILNVIY
ncbi:hypothetical protein BDZ91DRAFT_379891 [Kalaharituber pfeilii]|nr:hypothetical protein BDZ91DRAFT_379891 [Kalaharituber pfeilii]